MWTCILEVTDIQLCNATEKGKHVKHTEFLHFYITAYSHAQYGISSPSGQIFIHDNDMPYQDSDMQKISNTPT